MAHYEQVANVTDVDRLTEAVRRIQGQLWVDRMEATVEAHALPAAHVRERCTIPGTSVRTAYLCRDKPSMKETLRQAGVPCADSIAADHADQVRAFAEAVGFPLILKPRAAAGAAGTQRVDSPQALEDALAALGASGTNSIAVEEFVEGHEGFYDTLCVDGQPVYDFVSHYYPNVLDAMRERWISPQFIATNRIDTPGFYGELRDLGRRVIEALSIDIYREWASSVVHGSVQAPLSRRLSAGIVALRPDQDGVISGYEGLDEIQQRHGPHIIDAHLPLPGTPTQAVEAGYMANAWVRMARGDYDELRSMLDDVGRTVHVRAA